MWGLIWRLAFTIMVGGARGKLNFIWMAIPNSQQSMEPEQKIILVVRTILIPIQRMLQEFRKAIILNLLLLIRGFARLLEAMGIIMFRSALVCTAGMLLILSVLIKA